MAETRTVPGARAASGATTRPRVSDEPPANPLLDAERHRRSRSRWWWVRTISPLIWVCLLVIAAFIASGLFAGVIAPHDPAYNSLRARLQPPAFMDGGSREHLLGTDQLGRDLLSRLIHGARVSLTIGFIGMATGAIVGALCGLVSGFLRGVLDEVMMFLVDAFVALPFLIVALSAIAIFGRSVGILVVLAALAGWANYTRVSRGLALAAREHQYVLAARSTGARPRRVLLRHVMPNITAPLIVLATFELTAIILLEASLSFLGFGVQPPTPAWGSMVSDGREYLHTAWWIGVFPGLAIMVVTISVSLTGDWLRDVLDPTLRSR